jgi:hypothetical protein
MRWRLIVKKILMLRIRFLSPLGIAAYDLKYRKTLFAAQVEPQPVVYAAIRGTGFGAGLASSFAKLQSNVMAIVILTVGDDTKPEFRRGSFRTLADGAVGDWGNDRGTLSDE